jgi:hypothetical protein
MSGLIDGAATAVCAAACWRCLSFLCCRIAACGHAVVLLMVLYAAAVVAGQPPVLLLCLPAIASTASTTNKLLQALILLGLCCVGLGCGLRRCSHIQR